MASLAGGFPDIFIMDTQIFRLTNAGKKIILTLLLSPPSYFGILFSVVVKW